MTTKDIEPCEGFFVNLYENGIHVDHSIERSGEKQELVMKGIIGCYIPRKPVLNFRQFVDQASLRPAYYEIEDDPKGLQRAFDEYSDHHPAQVISLKDLFDKELSIDEYYFIPDEKPEMRKGD